MMHVESAARLYIIPIKQLKRYLVQYGRGVIINNLLDEFLLFSFRQHKHLRLIFVSSVGRFEVEKPYITISRVINYEKG